MIALLLISIFFQLVAAYFALHLIKTTGKINAWLLLSFAFLLMAIRRFSSLIGTYFPRDEFLFRHEAAESVGLLASVLIFIGVILIARVFKQAKADSDTVKKVLNELAISEERFKNLMVNLPAVAYTLLFKKDLIFQYISPVIRMWTGKSPEEFYKRPVLWDQMIHPQDRERISRQMQESISSGEKFSAEYRILTKSGDWIWVRNEGFPSSHAKTAYKQINGILTDISFQKESELRLRQLNSTFQTVSKINRLIAKEKDIRVLIQSVCDILTETQNYLSAWVALVDENNKFVQFATSGIGEPFQKLISLLEKGELPPCVKATQEKSEGYFIEDVQTFCKTCPLAGIHGHCSVWIAPLLHNGQLFGFINIAFKKNAVYYKDEKFLWEEIVSDISYGLYAHQLEEKRRLMKQALQQSEERFRSIVETSQEGIFIINSNYKIIYCNREMTQILGRQEPEIVGHNFQEFLDAESIPIVEDRYRRRQRGENVPARYQFKIVRGSGEVRWVEISASVINENTPDAQSIATILDITDQIKLQEQFLQAQKMEAIGRLAGGVAHDFNNILTAINGYAQLILSEMKPDNSFREDIEEIYKAGHRAANITRQLLAFSRRQVLEPKIISLNDVINESQKMIQRVIGEDVDLVFHADENLGTVYVDPGQIDQILLNLAINAKDAMPEGGQLIVETSNALLTEDYTRNHINVKPGDYVLLAVTDTGAGMTKEIVNHIFEPFFTTKEKGRGTGLGLSTVYGIVKQSGGIIWVYSEPGKGTTFKIYFPRVNYSSEEIGLNEFSQKDLRGTETILIVEDEQTVLEVASRSLEKLGYKILMANNGQEALKIVQNYSERIHLILTDVVMPKISGYKLIQKVKKIRSDFKVLFMSGYPDRTITTNGFLKSGLAFIQKPFTPKGIAKKVRDVLNAQK